MRNVFSRNMSGKTLFYFVIFFLPTFQFEVRIGNKILNKIWKRKVTERKKQCVANERIKYVTLNVRWGCPRGVMVKVMDYGSEFELQSRYYVHFRTNTPGYEPAYPPSYGLNSTSTVRLGEWLWH